MSVSRQLSDEGRAYCVLTAQDGGVVLDVEHDRLLKLNPTAAEIWALVTAGEPEPQIVLKIAERYGANQERVTHDVRALLGKIADLAIGTGTSILVGQERPSTKSNAQPSFPWYGQSGSETGPEPKRTTVFWALIGLAAFDLVLWLSSLKFLCFVVRTWPVKRASPACPGAIGKACKAVEKACVWYPKRALCLQRSAVTTCLLRSLGIPAHMTIGVRPMPLLAHAWVEVDGSVVNDWSRVKGFYHSLVSC